MPEYTCDRSDPWNPECRECYENELGCTTDAY